MAVHLGNELVGIRVQHARERSVVAGQDHLEVEELLAGEGRRLGAHGEAVADRHDADVGLVELRDQGHAAEHVGVAHVIERLAVLGRG